MRCFIWSIDCLSIFRKSKKHCSLIFFLSQLWYVTKKWRFFSWLSWDTKKIQNKRLKYLIIVIKLHFLFLFSFWSPAKCICFFSNKKRQKKHVTKYNFLINNLFEKKKSNFRLWNIYEDCFSQVFVFFIQYFQVGFFLLFFESCNRPHTLICRLTFYGV